MDEEGAMKFKKISNGQRTPKRLILVLTIIVLLLINTQGCLTSNVKYSLSYDASYDQLLNSTAVFNAFDDHNVPYTLNIYNEGEAEDFESFQFSFGKDINNESLETTSGSMFFHLEGKTTLSLWLGGKYPPVDDENELDQRKPILEASMDYILEIIFEGTNQWPDKKDMRIGDSY
jgi:hypothetical protein